MALPGLGNRSGFDRPCGVKKLGRAQGSRREPARGAPPEGASGPHTRPVWGVWRDGGFWFSTGSQARRNLEANAAITVHLESGEEVVIVEGVAERVMDLDASGASWRPTTRSTGGTHSWKATGCPTLTATPDPSTWCIPGLGLAGLGTSRGALPDGHSRSAAALAEAAWAWVSGGIGGRLAQRDR